MPRQNLSQQTADRLYTTIVVEQQLQPGEKLPNELELAQQLGVSRATLREAIRTLAGGRTLAAVIVEQNVKVALDVADYVLALRGGRVIFEGPASEVSVDKLWDLF